MLTMGSQVPLSLGSVSAIALLSTGSETLVGHPSLCPGASSLIFPPQAWSLQALLNWPSTSRGMEGKPAMASGDQLFTRRDTQTVSRI